VTRNLLSAALFLAHSLSPATVPAQPQTPPSSAATTAPAILNAAEAGKILPPSVYFRGQSAPIQARNSAGVRFSNDSLMLVTLVDNSGYASQVAQKYQAYFITEAALAIAGHRLPAGAYGVGFIEGDSFIVMDLGGHDLFTAHTNKDAALRRPTPLQILPDPGTPGAYRLFAGRTFIPFTLATP
jgi:hypothetical protein